MKQFKVIPIVAILISVLMAGTATKASADEAVILDPGAGMSKVVGTKRATTFFYPKSGECEITLLLADVNVDTKQEYLSASRLKIRLTPGNITRIDGFKGESLSIVCNEDAKTLTVVDKRLKLTNLAQ